MSKYFHCYLPLLYIFPLLKSGTFVEFKKKKNTVSNKIDTCTRKAKTARKTVVQHHLPVNMSVMHTL